ncbi:uncharacterized protein LOC116200337 [Punica granatum]|uniref:Uncharacterized protein LOC116200337 n=1 Tax=Punica granatum TaxID=22663 RepID=A0A6P8D099_PUNGR|nr:uncharacterized protein LOC116200337 [Punica granatum]
MEGDHANNLNNHINGALNLEGSNTADDTDFQQNVPANNDKIANEDLTEVADDYEHPQEGLALRLARDGSTVASFSSTIEVGDSSSGDEWAIASISMAPPEGESEGISTGESASSISAVNQASGQAESRTLLGVQDSSPAPEAAIGLLDLNPSDEIGGRNRMMVPNPIEYHQHESLAPPQYSDILGSLSHPQVQPVLPPSLENGSPSLMESHSYVIALPAPTSSLVGGPSVRRSSLTPQHANHWRRGPSNTITRMETQPSFASLTSSVPMTPAEFSEFSMAYISERYEQELANGMTDEEARYFFNDDIDENEEVEGGQSIEEEVAGGEEVAEPTTERQMELVNRYNRIFRTVELPTPDYDPTVRARLVSEVNIAIAEAYRTGSLRAEDIRSIQTPMLVRVPGEAPDAHATLHFNADNMSYEVKDPEAFLWPVASDINFMDYCTSK